MIATGMVPMLRMRPRLAGFIEPCLPSPAPNPPAGAGWLHEIKHDGFRIIARKNGAAIQKVSASPVGLLGPLWQAARAAG